MLSKSALVYIAQAIISGIGRDTFQARRSMTAKRVTYFIRIHVVKSVPNVLYSLSQQHQLFNTYTDGVNRPYQLNLHYRLALA